MFHHVIEVSLALTFTFSVLLLLKSMSVFPVFVLTLLSLGLDSRTIQCKTLDTIEFEHFKGVQVLT